MKNDSVKSFKLMGEKSLEIKILVILDFKSYAIIIIHNLVFNSLNRLLSQIGDSKVYI